MHLEQQRIEEVLCFVSKHKTVVSKNDTFTNLQTDISPCIKLTKMKNRMELTGSHEDFPDDGGGESSTGNKKIRDVSATKGCQEAGQGWH